MTAEPFLIAHKVRGQAALDVAEPMIVDGETWWIIPTSGHRAYPYGFGLSRLVDPAYGKGQPRTSSG